jgi:hypothetical protein
LHLWGFYWNVPVGICLEDSARSENQPSGRQRMKVCMNNGFSKDPVPVDNNQEGGAYSSNAGNGGAILKKDGFKTE